MVIDLTPGFCKGSPEFRVSGRSDANSYERAIYLRGGWLTSK